MESRLLGSAHRFPSSPPPAGFTCPGEQAVYQQRRLHNESRFLHREKVEVFHSLPGPPAVEFPFTLCFSTLDRMVVLALLSSPQYKRCSVVHQGSELSAQHTPSPKREEVAQAEKKVCGPGPEQRGSRCLC